eukprot:175107_1
MSNTNGSHQSNLTKQERHDIIITYLKQIKKSTKVFHLRWRPGELLNAKMLGSTPMFWYMKYQWSRQEIEEMFYKAQIEIDPLFDSALQEVFGGDPGPRWRSINAIPTQPKWKQRHTDNVTKWRAQQTTHLKVNDEKINTSIDSATAQLNSTDFIKNRLAQSIASNTAAIWNAVSDFGADKSVDYKVFSDNLKDRGINVSPFLAKQLFDQLAKPSGTISKEGMEVLIKQLDQVQLPNDFVNITWKDLASTLGTQLVMKRVLLAAGTGEPFNVDDFIFATKYDVKISPIQYMNKLTNRDVPWDDRLRTMEELSVNIGDNPLFNDVLSRANIPELLCGWSTQILDHKPEVQKTAIQLVPNIFHHALHLGQGSPQVAINHLDEILSNLFVVLDDPNASKHHGMTKKVINAVVHEVIALNDPESILYLSGILSEKCDLENITTAACRMFAVQQMKRIIFEDDGGIPSPGSAKREWLDIAADKQREPVPSKAMAIKYKRRGPPFAILESYPKQTFPGELVQFDASKSHDFNHKPCVQFTFDFGDGSKAITQPSPLIEHKYAKIGEYDVKLTVTDATNQNANAMVTQRVIDVKGIGNNKDDMKSELETVGHQFRGVMSNAIGMIFEDPNKEISKEGKRLIDVMRGLNPKWHNLMDPTTVKRYDHEFPMKPYDTEKKKDQIAIDAGTAQEHLIYNPIKVNIESEYPDI